MKSHDRLEERCMRSKNCRLRGVVILDSPQLMSHHAPSLEHQFLTRRDFLHRCGMGMGALALGGILGQTGIFGPTAAMGASPLNPLTPKAPHFPGKAKRVIHLFMNGGPSHVDTFDPKPVAQQVSRQGTPWRNTQDGAEDGRRLWLAVQVSEVRAERDRGERTLRQDGESIDDICVIRSMHADVPNHEPSLLLMNCGEARLVRPSLGSWVTYGLGTENQNLPGFISMCPGGYPIQESQNWQAGFLPGVFQGTYIDTKHQEVEKLIENIRNKQISLREQRDQLDLLQQLNAEHIRKRPRMRSSRRASSRSSSRIACRWMRPTPSTSARSRGDPRDVRARRAGAADAHRPPADRARRALRAGLARRGAAVGQPRRHRGQSSPARR